MKFHRNQRYSRTCGEQKARNRVLKEGVRYFSKDIYSQGQELELILLNTSYEHRDINWHKTWSYIQFQTEDFKNKPKT